MANKPSHPAVHVNNPNFFVWASLVVVTLITIAVVALVYSSQTIKEAFAYPDSPEPSGWVTDGTVNSIVSDATRTYIGGDFTYVGEYTGATVKLNATTGQIALSTPPLNVGSGSVEVQAVEPDGSGGWFVGGTFKSIINGANVDGVAAERVVHFKNDGTLDTTFDVDIPTNLASATVSDMVIDASTNTLYLGGSFATIIGNGVSATRNDIAAVDLTTGAVKSWNPNSSGGTIFRLALVGDRVYVAGAFTNIAGVARSRVAALGKVGSGSLAEATADVWAPNICNGQVNEMAVKSDNSAVYLGGTFTQTQDGGVACNSNTTYTRLVAFDGANSVNLGTRATWDPDALNTVSGMLLSTDEQTIYVSGDFVSLDGAARTRIGALSADTTNANPISTTWTTPTLAATGTSLVQVGSNVIAGGTFTSASGSTRYRIAVFAADPTGAGDLQPLDPKTNSDVIDLATDGTNLYVGGAFSSAAGAYRTRVAAFTNSTMDLDAGFDPGTTFNDAGTQVLRLAVSGTELYAGGDFLVSGGAARNRLAKVHAVTGALDAWDPNVANGQVEDLLIDSADATMLYVGGTFTTTIGGQTRSRLARLSTTTALADTWNPNSDGAVHVMRQDTTHVYVGGDFTAVGGDADAGEGVEKISKADGTADVNFISGLTTGQVAVGTHMEISGDGTQLYVYYGANSTAGRDLARLSTTTGAVDGTWFSGVNNVNNQVSAMELDNAAGKLYIGGNFTTVTVGSAQTRTRAAELGTDGTISAWDPGFGASVNDIQRQGDNALLIGGSFATTGAVTELTIQSRTGYAAFTTNTIQFTLASSSGSEATTPANLELSLAATDGADTTVDYAVTGGTASGSGVDYTLASGTATITAGTLTTNIPITVVNDSFHEADETIVVTLSNASANATIGANASHTYTITDNDPATVVITESGGSTAVTEGGATDSYTVVLTSQPTADVTVTLGSAGQASAAPSPLTFTSGDWSTPQTVTVTAVNDDIAEGPHNDAITHTVASADADYNGYVVSNVSVSITDNDVASVSITESGGSTQVTEGGAGDSYDVVLTSEPTDTVTVTLTVDPQLTAGPSPLTFTTGDWDTPQTVTVNADDDAAFEGLHNASITHAATSNDGDYNAIAIDQVDVTITDNDSPAVNITESGGGTTVTEGGATDSYDVVLNTLPTDTVTITLTPDADVSVAPNPLTFTTGDWNTPQTVTVTAVNDAIAEGTHNGLVEHAAASSDTDYNNIAIVDVTASITDNETAGITLSESGGSTQIAESGTTDSYTIVLTSEPLNDVTITLGTGDDADAAPSPLTFTSGNWSVPQTVTVTPVNDAIAEGTHADTVTHTLSSADSGYNNLSVASVTATVADNDTAGVTVTESGGSTAVTEGGATDTYTVVLTSEPTANVQITLNIVNQVAVNPSVLLFTSGDWSVPQTVIVSAVDDSSNEGTHSSTIVQSAVSTDPNYSGIAVDDVSVTITDDDSAVVPPPTPDPGGEPTDQTINQIGGVTTRSQSIAVSQARFAEAGSANGAVIANELTAVDAYTSEGLVGQNNYVLMLSDGQNISADTLLELDRALGNKGKPIYLVGGVRALSENIEEDLKAAGWLNVLRLAGEDRRRTAELVAEAIAQHNPQGRGDIIFLSEDRELIDGLSAGAATAPMSDGYATPILVTPRLQTQLDQSVVNFIKNYAVKKVQIIGGPAAIPFEIDAQIRGFSPSTEIVRFAGGDRFQTNRLISEAFFRAPNTAIAARGDRPGSDGETATTANTLVTALLANTLGGQIDAPVVLVTGGEVPDPTLSYLRDHGTTLEKLFIVADFDALSPSVVEILVSLF